MGMTIEDHIEVLKSYNHGFTGCAGNLQDSIDAAIDTMRKYQRIQEVLEKVWNASSCTLNKTPTFNLECLIEIMETYRTVR